jgi:broad specificity phosphatase PhoE
MLVLVRHGRTEANANGLLLGRLDPPLDATGRAQASALASVVAGAATVVSSPLRRAVETARLLLPDLEPVIDERWIEIDYGDLDGQPLASVPRDLWAAWRADPGLSPAGGESLTEVGARVRSACALLSASARDADVVVVSHVSPIKAAVAWALGADDGLAWRMFLAPASVTRIAVDPARGPVLHSYNETANVAGVGDSEG